MATRSSAVARTVRFSQVLWILTTVWLAACGRIGFGAGDNGGSGGVPDAGGIGSKPPGDGAVNAPDAPTAPPPDSAPIGPQIAVIAPGTMQTFCGGSTPPGTLAIQNIGDQDLQVSNILTTNGFTNESKITSATIKPGQTTTLSILPPKAIVGTDLGGAEKTGMVQLTTNVPDAPSMQVPLTATVVGANITITAVTNGVPKNLVFEASSGSCPASQSVTFQIDHVIPGTLIPIKQTGLFNLGGFPGGTVQGDTQETTVVSVASGNTCVSGGSVSFGTGANGICKIDTTAVTFHFASGSTSCFCS
jgi:hypothetical protein